MKEFGFYGIDEDKHRIINAIFTLGDYALIPDLNYDKPTPKIYASSESDLFEAVTRKKRLYVTGPFAEKPVSLRPIKGGQCDGGYYIDEARGGPLLMLSLPGCKQTAGLTELVPGDFFYRAEYWDDKTTHPLKPSDKLKSHYKRIKDTIKEHLVRKSPNNIWIGVAAWELLIQGKANILYNGNWWDGKWNLVRSN